MTLDIEKLLVRVNIEQLATEAGAEFGRANGYRGRSACPLHHGDNKRAFSVHQDPGERGYWRCYTACDDGGDAIAFVQKWRGTDFMDSVKFLAERFGVRLEDIGFSTQDANAEQERRKRLDILTEAAKYYKSQLWSPAGEQALDYLHRRGLTDETIKEAKLGFSSSDNGLVNHLKDVHADLRLAYELTLMRPDGSDFTAAGNGAAAAPNGYIVFPHLHGERVTYLSSRAVEVEEVDRPDPKDKSRNLQMPRQIYRFDVPGRSKEVLVIEGQIDALTVWQLGFSVRALCGLGEMPQADLDQLRKCEVIYIATDSDAAGNQAITKQKSKVSKMATYLGPLTMILPQLKDGKDFNAWLTSETPLNKEDIEDLKSRSKTWIETRMDQASVCPPNEYDERIQEIGRLLAVTQDSSKPRYIKKAQEILGISRNDINRLISQALNQDDTQILSCIKDGKICFLGKPLGNFSAQITHELTLDDGLNPPVVKYTLQGKLSNGISLDPVDIEAGEFPEMRWISKSWGARPVLYVNRGGYHDLSRAIQEVSIEKLKREKVYTYTGWMESGDERVYLSTSGKLHQGGLDPDTRVELENNLKFYALPEPPKGQDLYNAIRASLDFLTVGKREVTAPLWACMFAAPLTQIRPLYALVWVYGVTQSGKSTISHLALTHYGPGFILGRQYNAPADWLSTAVALEGLAFQVKDAVLIIDDYAPQFASKHDAIRQAMAANYLVRSVGNRSSRSRSNADLTAKTTRVPRGLVIATAENPLVGQSTVGRMIYIPVSKGDVFPLDTTEKNLKLEQAQQQAQSGLYAQAMSAYLQWLAANWQDESKAFIDRIDVNASRARSEFPQLQNRLPDYFALLHSAQTIALDCFTDLGVISSYEAQQIQEANRQAILNIIINQADTIASESPVRKYFEAISSLLETSKAYLEPKGKGVMEFTPPQHAELIGWIDDPFQPKVVYLMMDITLTMAKDYWRSLDENMDIMKDALRRQIAQVPDLLAQQDKNQFEASVWIAGKTRRVLAVSIKRVFDLYGVTITNEIRDQKEPEH